MDSDGLLVQLIVTNHFLSSQFVSKSSILFIYSLILDKSCWEFLPPPLRPLLAPTPSSPAHYWFEWLKAAWETLQGKTVSKQHWKKGGGNQPFATFCMQITSELSTLLSRIMGMSLNFIRQNSIVSAENSLAELFHGHAVRQRMLFNVYNN